MGLIGQVMTFLFGGGRNVVTETVEVFRENAEAGAVRAADAKSASLAQFTAEFAIERRGWFDRFIDGINRLPRPMLALGTIALFISAMWDPDWFVDRMVGVAMVPEPLWWLMGAIVSFYFGARHQVKGQAFQEQMIRMAASAPRSTALPSDNQALADWMASDDRK